MDNIKRVSTMIMTVYVVIELNDMACVPWFVEEGALTMVCISACTSVPT